MSVIQGYDLEKQGDLLISRYSEDSDLRHFVHVAASLQAQVPLVMKLETECGRLRTKIAEIERTLSLVDKALHASSRCCGECR